MVKYSIKVFFLILMLAVAQVACSSLAPSTDPDSTTGTNNEEAQNGGIDVNSQEDQSSEDSNETGSTEPNETEKIDLSLLFPDDATNISIQEDFVSCITKMSLDALTEFYKSEMETYGYTLGTEMKLADTLFLRFVNGPVAIRITTSSDGEGGFFLLLDYDE